MQVVIVSCPKASTRLIDALRCFGISAQCCVNLTDACELVDLYGFDLALVDAGFAGGGQAAVKALRVTHKALPIVVFGADIAREHGLACLSSGADDIFRWPSDAEILAARIRAIVRRCRGADAAAVQIGPLQFDMIRRSLQINNQPVMLTSKEYSILEYLFTHKGFVSTKDALLNQLYGGRDAPDIRIIDVFVCKLRKKLAEYGVHGLIETTRGLGYVLNIRACQPAREASDSRIDAPKSAQVA